MSTIMLFLLELLSAVLYLPWNVALKDSVQMVFLQKTKMVSLESTVEWDDRVAWPSDLMMSEAKDEGPLIFTLSAAKSSRVVSSPCSWII